MYVKPGYLAQTFQGYGRVKQKTIQQKLLEMDAAGIKDPAKFIFVSNQSDNGKGTDKTKNKIGCGDGDEDYVPFNDEERLSCDSDNEVSSRSKANKSINTHSNSNKCKLLDWMGTGEVVAEGRWSSSDPKALVHHIPIGPLTQ